VEPAEAGELVDQDAGLEPQLGVVGGVLEVAAAALAGAGPRAGRLHAVGRGRDDLDGVGEREPLLAAGDLDAHPLARQGVAADVPLAVDAGHTVASGSDVPYGDDHRPHQPLIRGPGPPTASAAPDPVKARPPGYYPRRRARRGCARQWRGTR